MATKIKLPIPTNTSSRLLTATGHQGRKAVHLGDFERQVLVVLEFERLKLFVEAEKALELRAEEAARLLDHFEIV